MHHALPLHPSHSEQTYTLGWCHTPPTLTVAILSTYFILFLSPRLPSTMELLQLCVWGGADVVIRVVEPKSHMTLLVLQAATILSAASALLQVRRTVMLTLDPRDTRQSLDSYLYRTTSYTQPWLAHTLRSWHYL